MLGINSNKKQEDEVKEENVDSKVERKEAKKTALATLKDLVDKQEDKKYQEALKVIRPSLYGVARIPGSPKTSAYNKFIKFVEEKKTVSEDIIFKEFKIGRKECAGYVRKHLKKAAPAERTWILFDGTTGMYRLAGKGAEAPKSWDGFVPVEDDVELS